VDTGSQVTVIDPSLASQLDLRPQGKVGLVTVASFSRASATTLDSVEANSKVVENSPAIVQDLRQIQAADPRIRGVLGESFLAQFDLFVDYDYKLLCLDETNAMQDNVRGERIPLIRPQRSEDELPFLERLVIAVHLSGTGPRAILLQLDSGSDGPILYASSKDTEVKALVQSATLRGDSATSAQRAFAVVPPQNMRIGNHIFTHISFVTPVTVQESLPGRNEDGLLPTLLFQRVFISGGGHYVILDPK
jgi:hypothetical protein